MPKINFKQIACSEAIDSVEGYSCSLYGLTEEGKVYQYSESKDTKGWHPLNMIIKENLPINKPTND